MMGAARDSGPDAAELQALGLPPDAVTQVTLLRAEHGSRLYRLATDAGSYVLKQSASSDAVEVRAYRLLSEHGVPTLPVCAQTERALLLEDLATSHAWRPAEEQDMAGPAAGTALGRWYRALHDCGARLAAGSSPPSFLAREVAALDAPSLLAAGQRLGCAGYPAWTLAVEHVEALKQAFLAFPETLNYNDFHWTNLALSRTEPLQAIVFDYHLLGLGPAWCDWRNVRGSLGAAAREAFREAYGELDERPALLDAPLADLYSLCVAAQLPSLPAWARGCLESVTNGELEHDLRVALACLAEPRGEGDRAGT